MPSQNLLIEAVENAKAVFRRMLERLDESGGFTKDHYIRYLSFQYHLTKGVQRHFLKVAAHPSLSHRKPLRTFLFRFALEEEPHYMVARHDLAQLGVEPLPCTLDVALWWAFYDRIVEERPFIRLGATCVLENLGAGAGALGHRLLDEADFLDRSNTRFLEIHFHEALPHGDQILAALDEARLDSGEMADAVEGAQLGAIQYLRMAGWALRQDPLTSEHFDPSISLQRIEDGIYRDLESLTRS